jgi:hypothetical protein
MEAARFFLLIARRRSGVEKKAGEQLATSGPIC